MQTSTFLAVDRGRTQWGVHAKIVHNVLPSREWSGSPPFDVARVLGLEARGADEPLVILLVSDVGLSPFWAFGKLGFRQVDVELVQPVPAIVRNPYQRQLVSGVVLDDTGPPLVVLDPVGLLSLAKEASAA